MAPKKKQTAAAVAAASKAKKAKTAKKKAPTPQQYDTDGEVEVEVRHNPRRSGRNRGHESDDDGENHNNRRARAPRGSAKEDDDYETDGLNDQPSESETEEDLDDENPLSHRIRIPLADDQVALQLQLSQQRSKIEELERNNRNERAAAGAQLLVRSKDVKKQIKECIYTHLFHTCKFITEDEDLDRAMYFVLDKLGLAVGWSDEKKASWVLTYRQWGSTCLCEKRNYTQSQTRQAILDHVQAIEPTNVPVDAGEGNENHPPAGDNLLPPPVVFSEALMLKCVIR